jgi:hypothetical protein
MKGSNAQKIYMCFTIGCLNMFNHMTYKVLQKLVLKIMDVIQQAQEQSKNIPKRRD